MEEIEFSLWLFCFFTKAGQKYAARWAELAVLFCRQLKKPSREFNFFYIFGIPSSSRHGNPQNTFLRISILQKLTVCSHKTPIFIFYTMVRVLRASKRQFSGHQAVKLQALYLWERNRVPYFLIQLLPLNIVLPWLVSTTKIQVTK